MYSLRAEPSSTTPRRSGRYSRTAVAAVENNENVDTMNAEAAPAAATPKRRGRPPKIKPPPPPAASPSSSSSSSSRSSDNPPSPPSECSPPKQRRTGREQNDEEEAAELASPKRLLAQLSLSADRPSPHHHHHHTNKYQNARQVLNSAATQKMPGREREFQELHEMLEQVRRTNKSMSVYVSGQPGTGKTATLAKLLQSDVVVQGFSTVSVNCTGIASIGSIYKRICDGLALKVRGGSRTEKECLATIERYFQGGGGRQKPVLLLLDEIDQLLDKKQKILYTIFEWPSRFPAGLMLVSIANALDLTDRMLSRLNAVGEQQLKPRLMHFPPYTKQQICDIFNERLREAGVLHIFPPLTIQLLAGKVAAVSGDVRRALDIGRRVIEIAEQQQQQGKKGSGENLLRELGVAPLEGEQKHNEEEEEKVAPIQVGQVVSVLNNVYGASQALNEELDEAYPLQQKISICALLLLLRNEKNKDVSLGRLHDVYRRICGRRNLPAVDQMEFVGLCELIETRGMLKIVGRKKEPRLAKIRLQWDEDEVRTALQDKQLIAAILSDATPLTTR